MAQDMYDNLRKLIPAKNRAKAAELILNTFDHHDADDWDEGSQLWRDSGRPTWEETHGTDR